MQLKEFIVVLDEALKPHLFRDYCPNGLQVEASAQIESIVTGVTACEALIDAAIEQKANAILVHHGYFWKGEPQAVKGIKATRLKKLFQNEISLLAYHLPLDAHSELGNNFLLGQALGIQNQKIIEKGRIIDLQKNNTGLLFLGELPPQTLSQFSQTISEKVGPIRVAVCPEGEDYLNSKKIIRKVAWCTGAAQDYLLQAVEHGADVFITGEISERTVHEARETGVTFIAAGHHATERFGIRALGEWVNQHTSVINTFIDIPNPV